MITCPECGQAAPDGARFCDRCGQGLSKSASAPPPPTRPTPLEAGATLRGGIEIVELTTQTSVENRYRAKRTRDGKSETIKTETIALRERFGPKPAADQIVEQPAPELPIAPTPIATEDPNGPRAKTAELRPAASQPNGSANAASSHPPIEFLEEPNAAPEQPKVIATAVTTTAATESATAADVQNVELPNEQPADGAPADSNGKSTTAGIAADATSSNPVADTPSEPAQPPTPQASQNSDDLGEVFGRVLALSQTISHPAYLRASEGFAQGDRVYLVYPDQQLTPVRRAAKLSEADAIAYAVQLCQAIGFIHRRGLRVNDICPESVAIASNGRLTLTGLDYVTNDNELQSEPIFNDGYTAPEIYRNKKADKRADVFSAGALLYTWLTGERIPSESWREEAGPVRFYPPHVVTPPLEQAVRRAIAFNPSDRWPNIDEFKTELIRIGSAIRLRAAALTDVGRVREHNEDSVMALEYSRESMIEPSASYLYVVADGMGGAEAGEVASAIAVQAIRGYVESGLSSSANGGGAAELLAAALEEANSKIIEYVASRPESRGMGSTGVCALIRPPDAAVAWVGDSRAYLLDGQTLRQVTRDHSLVQRLVEIGQITAEEARTHEHKNVITRSLGARQSGPAGAESVSLKLKRGDKLMLCSDGLTAHVEDHQIQEILGRHHDPFDAARELIVAANAGGGTDNITVVVVFAS